MKISIVIPAHNEEKRIGQTLKEYSSYFGSLKKRKILDYELFIVINNTKDRTEALVRAAAKKDKNVRFVNIPKGGKGNAVIVGFKDALNRANDLIGFVDADLATTPEAFYDLIKRRANADGVIASRYVPGAIVKPRNTLPRIFASRIYNMVIRALLLIPYRDTQCGAKIFTRKAVEKTIGDIGMTRFAFDIELLYKMRKAGFRIKEAPTVWADKKYSTINFWHSGPWMALAVLRLRLLNSPFRFLVRVYDKVLSRIYKFHEKLK